METKRCSCWGHWCITIPDSIGYDFLYRKGLYFFTWHKIWACYIKDPQKLFYRNSINLFNGSAKIQNYIIKAQNEIISLHLRYYNKALKLFPNHTLGSNVYLYWMSLRSSTVYYCNNFQHIVIAIPVFMIIISHAYPKK